MGHSKAWIAALLTCRLWAPPGADCSHDSPLALAPEEPGPSVATKLKHMRAEIGPGSPVSGPVFSHYSTPNAPPVIPASLQVSREDRPRGLPLSLPTVARYPSRTER